MLMAARCGGLWTGARAARRGIIGAMFLLSCPCCGALEVETLPHLMLSCGAWVVQRAKFLDPILEELPSGVYDEEELTTLLLGGVIADEVIPNWCGAPSSENGNPVFKSLLLFFDSIYLVRNATIWEDNESQRYMHGSPSASAVG